MLSFSNYANEQKYELIEQIFKKWFFFGQLCPDSLTPFIGIHPSPYLLPKVTIKGSLINLWVFQRWTSFHDRSLVLQWPLKATSTNASVPDPNGWWLGELRESPALPIDDNSPCPPPEFINWCLGPDSIEKKSNRKWHPKRHPTLHVILLRKRFLKSHSIHVFFSKTHLDAILDAIFDAIFSQLNRTPGSWNQQVLNCQLNTLI